MEIKQDTATKILEELGRIAYALEVLAIHAEPAFQPKTTQGMYLKQELLKSQKPK
jgi:hypothetical protein